MYSKLRKQGLEIVAIPVNTFGQEQGSANRIANLARVKYKAKYTILEKMEANGEEAHPIFIYLRINSALHDKKARMTFDLPWSWSKFLVDEQGRVLKFYAPQIYPSMIAAEIEEMLRK